MQPQVHWEPVEVMPNRTPRCCITRSCGPGHGGRTLVGATPSSSVPALPGVVGDEIAAVANG